MCVTGASKLSSGRRSPHRPTLLDVRVMANRAVRGGTARPGGRAGYAPPGDRLTLRDPRPAELAVHGAVCKADERRGARHPRALRTTESAAATAVERPLVALPRACLFASSSQPLPPLALAFGCATGEALARDAYGTRIRSSEPDGSVPSRTSRRTPLHALRASACSCRSVRGAARTWPNKVAAPLVSGLRSAGLSGSALGLTRPSA
jgi:hypothetical protein